MTSPTPAILPADPADAIAPEPALTGAGSARAWWREADLRAWVGLLPFFTFLGLFLIVPTVAVFGKAFSTDDGVGTAAFTEAVSGQFRTYFKESIKLSAASAIIGGFLGLVLALVVVRLQRPRWLRTVVSAFAGVAANMGGIILAFMFIASLGVQGLATKIIRAAGVDIAADFITSFWGLVVVYLFFQIPLMFLVMLPAADGLKPAWREAVANLGGTSVTYWRRVGIPVLTPAALGGLLLLFANAFAAYATATALTTQSAQLVSVQIRFYLQGNIIAGEENVAYALAAWMIIIMLVTIVIYLVLRRRTERWQR